MRLDLYSTEYRDPLPEKTFHALLARLPTFLQQKVLKFRQWPDQHAALLGKLLLRRGADGNWPEEPEIVTGHATLTLASIDYSTPLSAFYQTTGLAA